MTIICEHRGSGKGRCPDCEREKLEARARGRAADTVTELNLTCARLAKAERLLRRYRDDPKHHDCLPCPGNCDLCGLHMEADDFLGATDSASACACPQGNTWVDHQPGCPRYSPEPVDPRHCPKCGYFTWRGAKCSCATETVSEVKK